MRFEKRVESERRTIGSVVKKNSVGVVNCYALDGFRNNGRRKKMCVKE